MDLLEIKNVSKTFPGTQVLNTVSFTIKVGEIHSVIGENGAGKSTLIKILAGVEKKDSGEIYFNGKLIENFSTQYLLNLGIAFAFQDESLFDNLSVAENFYLSSISKSTRQFLNWKNIVKDTDKFLKEYGFQSIKSTAIVSSLTFSEKQIIEILKAIKRNAKLICLDEPTTSLESSEIDRLFQSLKVFKEKGISIIYISHKLDEVLALSDRVTVLRDGKVVGTIEKKEMNKDILINLMIGRTITRSKNHIEKTIGGKEVLKLDNLGKIGLINGISFSLHEGEILGLSGLVGSGRTELAKLIFGLIRKDMGEIFINSRYVNISSPEKAIENGIFYLPEDRKTQGLFLSQNLFFNVSSSMIKKISRKTFINRKTELEKVGDIIRNVNVKFATLYQNAFYLSGGNQQKLLFAKSLFADPVVLILDEPTKGIDVGSKEEIYKMIQDLAIRGVSIILISSEIEEIVNLSDRVLVMKSGALCRVFEKEEINEQDISRCYLHT